MSDIWPNWKPAPVEERPALERQFWQSAVKSAREMLAEHQQECERTGAEPYLNVPYISLPVDILLKVIDGGLSSAEQVEDRGPGMNQT